MPRRKVQSKEQRQAAVLDAFREHPEWTAKQIAEHLSQTQFEITSQQAAGVINWEKRKSQNGHAGDGHVETRKKRRQVKGDAASDLIEVVRLSEKLGGFAKFLKTVKAVEAFQQVMEA